MSEFFERLNKTLMDIGNFLTGEPEMPSEEVLAKRRKEYQEQLKKESAFCPKCGFKEKFSWTSEFICDQLADYPYGESFRKYHCSNCGFYWEGQHERFPLDPEERRKYMKRVYGIEKEMRKV